MFIFNNQTIQLYWVLLIGGTSNMDGSPGTFYPQIFTTQRSAKK